MPMKIKAQVTAVNELTENVEANQQLGNER
jgi:hypothetical protein